MILGARHQHFFNCCCVALLYRRIQIGRILVRKQFIVSAVALGLFSLLTYRLTVQECDARKAA